jgi:dihydropyrimidinase
MMTAIRNGMVITESKAVRTDILIEGEKIVGLGESIPTLGSAETIDASGKIVFPGMIDAHTHVQWGYGQNRTVDDFLTGTAAAARGGVTTIIDFALQGLNISPLESVRMRREQIDGKTHVDYSLHVIMTDFRDNFLDEIPSVIAQGYPSFKLFMGHSSPQRVVSMENFEKLAELAKRYNGMIGIHGEKNEIIQKETQTLLSQRKESPFFFPFSRPRRAEIEAIREAIGIASEKGSLLYIFHLTTKEGLEEIRQARRHGVAAYTETCPHYLLFTEEVYGGEKGDLFLINPPLRQKEDIESLWAGLQEHVIQIVSSDHCAFCIDQKRPGRTSFMRAPAGIPGTELLFPLFFTEARKRGFTLNEVADILSRNPARIFGLYPKKGSIRIGADADLIIYDLGRSQRVDEAELHMGSDFSPYHGHILEGAVERTILRGKTILLNGQLMEGKEGTFMPRFIS